MSDDESKRRAVIVGINNYQDEKIKPVLEGAHNDAEDIHERLVNMGDFKIPENEHLLIGNKATGKAIRKAISDVFYHTDEEYEQALFYFSGHGCIDSYGDGYIMPWDMSSEDPLVSGIKISELKEIISRSRNHVDCAIAILDCCHSGIAAESGVRGSSNDIITFENHLDDFLSAEGVVVLTSCEKDEKSREIKLRHGEAARASKEKGHAHGAFTYWLIEGIDYGAPDDNGELLLFDLKNYVERELFRTGKQKPKSSTLDDSRLGKLTLVKRPDFYNIIDRKITDVEKICDEPRFYVSAVKLLCEVIERSPKKKEALDLKDNIDKILKDYKKNLLWLAEKNVDIQPRLPYAFPIIQKIVVNYHTFDGISKLDNDKKALLSYLFAVSSDQIDDETFVKMCKRYDNPPDSASSQSVTKSQLGAART